MKTSHRCVTLCLSLVFAWAAAVAADGFQGEGAEKVSPYLKVPPGEFPFLATSFQELTPGQWSALLSRCGARQIPNPYLAADTILVEGDAAHLAALAASAEIRLLWPPSSSILAGRPVPFCPVPDAPDGKIGKYATISDGWEGPGLNRATLGYSFLNMTADLQEPTAVATLLQAMSEWANYVQISFYPAANLGDKVHIDFMWAAGNHGDAEAFDGPGATVAHTRLVWNSRGIQEAHIHFDEAEGWQDTSFLYTIGLHEVGHALGLQHSSDPQAIMYAYPDAHSVNEDDVTGIRTLYMSTDTTFIPQPDPDPCGCTSFKNGLSPVEALKRSLGDLLLLAMACLTLGAWAKLHS